MYKLRSDEYIMRAIFNSASGRPPSRAQQEAVLQGASAAATWESAPALMRAASLRAAARSTLLVFDFDCTLAQEHLFTELRTETGVARFMAGKAAFLDWIFGGVPRMRKLAACLTALKATGATLVVLSNGVEEEIEMALKHAQIFQCFELVLGAEAQQRCGTATLGKPAMLARLAIERGVKAPSHIVFVDDDLENYPSGPATMDMLGSSAPAQEGDCWSLVVDDTATVFLRAGGSSAPRSHSAAAAAAAADSPLPSTMLIAWPVVPSHGMSEELMSRLVWLLKGSA